MNQNQKHDDVSIVLCGAAGQGIQTVEQLLTHLFHHSGYNLFSMKEYMSRVRGGSNSSEFRVSSKKVRAYVDRIDILFPLSREALEHVARRISPKTVIIGEKEKLLDGSHVSNYTIIDIPFSTMAQEIGNPLFVNIIATGVIAGIFGIDSHLINDHLGERFGKKGESVIEKNREAVKRGYDIGVQLSRSGVVDIPSTKDTEADDDIIISGGDAVGLGAIAGGCNFISSYPMTPSTAILTFLSHHSKDFHIVVEQAEDEIAAINMAIGAWYTGARGMVATSGGGFALMVEGLSLAGMLESPMVIHLGQRPGPATGLPTRTEQGDLLFTLYSGHGEFPRVIYTPGTLEDAFFLTQKAFNIADKYQVPVFILTDQYLVDSYYNVKRFDTSQLAVEKHIVHTERDYKRYRLTENGVSPRGIPGYGNGFIVVDSDEHDEEGHITEDQDVRTKMVRKRLMKGEVLKNESLLPELIGSEDCHTLIVTWGSPCTIVREAIEQLNRDDISLLYFKQVFPLHPDTPRFFKKAKQSVIIENNATSQFSNLLKVYTGIDIGKKILKYDGLPFSVEEIAKQLLEIIG